MSKIDYGEILFVGKCNCSCYYCLGNEMNKLKESINNNLNIHFKYWKSFDEFICKLKENNVSTIYLSSTIAEPLMYKYIDELTYYLKNLGFKVGIRTNGYFVKQHIDLFKEFEAEISLSLNSFNQETTATITGNNEIINWGNTLNLIEKLGQKCRVSIVVNKYNCLEVLEMLDKLSKYSCITYVQLRKIYKYYKELESEDVAFNKAVELLESNGKKVGNYYESEIYDYKGLSVSLWKDVFKKESLASLNYFTDGLLTDNTLLIPAYEGENE